MANDDLGVLLHKLGLVEVSELQSQTCLIAYNEELELTAHDAVVLARSMVEHGPCNTEYLFLPRNRIGDVGLKAIAEAMEAGALPNLLTVDFTACGASDAGFVHLVSAVKHSECFRDITFQQNGLTDVAMSALHAVLKRGEWPGIERLNLSGRAFEPHLISDASFEPFATDVANGAIKMIRLETLDLSNSAIGDAGFAAFATAIQRGNLRKLTSLHMNACRISDVGAHALAAALKNNKRTKLCDVRLGHQNCQDANAPRVTKEGGQAAIEAAGATVGRKVACVLHPLDGPGGRN